MVGVEGFRSFYDHLDNMSVVHGRNGKNHLSVEDGVAGLHEVAWSHVTLVEAVVGNVFLEDLDLAHL